MRSSYISATTYNGGSELQREVREKIWAPLSLCCAIDSSLLRRAILISANTLATQFKDGARS